jgi:dihydrofolate reductase
MQNRLIDEIRLLVFPVVLGKGKRLFADDSKPTELEVTHSTTTPSGVLGVTYKSAGDVKTGSFPDPPAKTRRRRNDQPHA